MWINKLTHKKRILMKSQSTKINKDLFEVHKPSGQISSKITKDGKLHQLTPIQFDAMNFICYNAREQFHNKFGGVEKLEKMKNEISEDDLFKFLADNWFEIDLNALTRFTETYKSYKNKSKLTTTIKELKTINVEMGVFKKHDLLVEDVFSLIRRYQKIQNQNKIKVMLEPEILIGWVFKTTPFKPLFLKIQTTLSQTYTKILYENLKDYESIGTLTKPLEQWNYIFGFDNNSSKLVSTLKRDFLNKSIDDINNNTDIRITKITGTKDDGLTYMTVEFEKQPESRLRELGLIQSLIVDNKFYNKSKSKLDALIKNGYNVIDESMWIETDINKNIEKYESEARIDLWLKDTDENDKNYVFEKIACSIDDCEDPIIFIENYKIVGVFSKEIFTKNASETILVLNRIILEISDN